MPIVGTSYIEMPDNPQTNMLGFSNLITGVLFRLKRHSLEQPFSAKSNEVVEASKFINLLLGKFYRCHTGLRGHVDFIQVASVKRI
jgi:hypothetical protein